MVCRDVVFLSNPRKYMKQRTPPGFSVVLTSRTSLTVYVAGHKRPPFVMNTSHFIKSVFSAVRAWYVISRSKRIPVSKEKPQRAPHFHKGTRCLSVCFTMHVSIQTLVLPLMYGTEC